MERVVADCEAAYGRGNFFVQWELSPDGGQAWLVGVISPMEFLQASSAEELIEKIGGSSDRPRPSPRERPG